jgi:hypothetical protein
MAVYSIAGGAVIEMKNGDRITGRILDKDSQYVYLKSDIFGKVDIPRERISRIIEDKIQGSSDSVTLPPVMNINSTNLATAPVIPPAPSSKPKTVKPAEASTAIPAVPTPSTVASVGASTSPTSPSQIDIRPRQPLTGRKYLSHMLVTFMRKTNFLDKWKTSLRVGYALYSGQTDSYSSTVTLLTERHWKKSEFRFQTVQDYATSTDEDGKKSVSRDALKVSGRYRYNINNRKMFFQSESDYGYSHVNGIDTDCLQSFGYGWRLLQSEVWYFCLVPSVAAQYQVIEGKSQGMDMAPTLYEEAEYKWTDTLLIHNEAYAIIPVNGDNNPTYHFSLMLQNKLVGNLSLNLEYLFDFDGSVKEDKDASTQSLRFSFGYDF